MQRQGVHVFRLRPRRRARRPGVRPGRDVAETLPAGTLYIPMEQPLKHWIQAVLGEDPYQPLNFFYDVAQWSYSLQRGQSGNGILIAQPAGVPMTEIADPAWGSAPAAGSAVYAFDTDSMQSGSPSSTELLDAGVKVSRGAEAFDAAGKHFETGAALVDGASLDGPDVNLEALAVERQTPGLRRSRLPGRALRARRSRRSACTPPSASEPNNPMRPPPARLRAATAASPAGNDATPTARRCSR